MSENKKIEVTAEEYEIICFFRKLPKKKKEKFIELLTSLEKLLILQKESE